MQRAATPGRKVLVHSIAAALTLPSALLASTIPVDGTTCTLADAIVSANTDTATGGCVAGNGHDAIQLTTGQFSLPSLPTVISDIDFSGNATLIVGDSGHRLFLIGDETHAPVVTFSNLVLAGGSAHGGNASSGGGGGAGLGGVMFIYDGTVSIDLSTFSENGATGGSSSGFVGAQHSGGGGGGGLLGNGGTGASTNEADGGNATVVGGFGGGGGGGGNTYLNEGVGGNGGNGSGGAFPGVGGVLFPDVTPPTAGGFGGGGGGGAAPASSASQAGAGGGFGGGGGGGAGSGTSINVDTPGAGADGGFGGGGGAGGSANSAQGAAGSFGGFGGGGGSAGSGSMVGVDGQGGFGGGDPAAGGGGGGAGFGAAIFIRSGHVTVTHTLFQSNFATRGIGTGSNGLAKGGAIFALDTLVNSNGNNQGMPAILPQVTGCANTFSSNFAQDAGTGRRDNPSVYGADSVYLALACGDAIFADGFGVP